jgi:NurA domain
MEQKLIIAASCAYLGTGHHHEKLLSEKSVFPIGHEAGFLKPITEIQVKFHAPDGTLLVSSDAKIEQIKDTACLKMTKRLLEAAVKRLRTSEYVFIVAEGSLESATVILCFAARGEGIFEKLEQENPALRLAASDLPPTQATPVDVPAVKAALYTLLAKNDPELFSLNAQRFLATPNILTHLFAHVMSLASADNMSYISTLRLIADQLRSLLGSRIRKVTKDHHKLWSTFYGERISFLDGGVSRIVALPGTEPMGIRVGIYTVTPGERDPEKRESWDLGSYVIGDVVNDRSIISDQNYRTDTKRLQEASRYILEPLRALLYIEASGEKRPRMLLVHGPLQNAFMEYDEIEPSYVPGVSKDFLAGVGIREKDVTASIADIPRDRDNKLLWNSCIPIYLYIMKRLWSSGVPLAGVVEHTPSALLARAVIESLVGEGRIPASTGKKLKDRLLRYEIGDELLFGCILEEGEYLVPIDLKKNFRRRAHDRWQPVVEQFPAVSATMIKCSATSFPYRVEMPVAPDALELESQVSLLYHMSLLLPNYAFPVGIDIADKYVRIPDWLSKGVSARLTASVLKRILETGDTKALFQVRRLLALSPRDFFFRPRA